MTTNLTKLLVPITAVASDVESLLDQCEHRLWCGLWRPRWQVRLLHAVRNEPRSISYSHGCILGTSSGSLISWTLSQERVNTLDLCGRSRWRTVLRCGKRSECLSEACIPSKGKRNSRNISHIARPPMLWAIMWHPPKVKDNLLHLVEFAFKEKAQHLAGLFGF